MINSHTTDKTEEIVHLSKAKRWFIYFIICAMHSCILINFGVLSSGISSIKLILNISDQEFGLFGTFHGLGGLIGSFVFMSLINVLNRKYFLLIVLVLHCVGLVLFCLVTHFYILIMIRSLNGICMVTCFIYCPLWVDQFGIQKYKSWMMTFLFLSNSLGMLWGYLINLFIGGEKWQKGLLVETFIVLLFAGILAVFPDTYFSKRVVKKTYLEDKDVRKEDKEERTSGFDSIFITQHLSNINADDTDSSSKIKQNKDSLWKNPLLILLSLSKAAQFFNSISVNYWYSDYLETALKVKDANTIFYSFTFVNILGPIFGMLIGGGISQLIGGYPGKHALLTVLIIETLGCPFAFFVPFLNDVKIFSIVLFGYKLCDNATGPLTTGLVLFTVSKELKGQAGGLLNLIMNIFAFLPAPFVYGYIKNSFSHISNRSAMFFSMYQGFTAALLMLIAFIIHKATTRTPDNEKDKSQFDKPQTEEVLLTDI